ncbi:MAG: hypothetical protein Q7S57_05235 [bacterium]|nr:hypothetical protein [bacterium]
MDSENIVPPVVANQNPVDVSPAEGISMDPNNFAPPPLQSEQPQKHGSVFFPVLLLIVVVLVVVGVGIAYFAFGWNPFQPALLPDQVISKMLDNVPTVKSAKYDAEITFRSEPRDPGALPMVLEAPKVAEQSKAVDRDRERMRVASNIMEELATYKHNHKTYPTNLADAVIDKQEVIDPLTGQQYGYRQEQGGASFLLHIQLETDSVTQAAQKGYDELVKTNKNFPPKTIKNRLIEIDPTSSIFSINVKPASTSPYPVTFGVDTIYQYLPVEIDAKINLSGQSDVESTKGADNAFSGSGKVTMGGSSFAGGLDIISKNMEYYARITEAPSLGFFDLASLKGKWIKATKDDLDSWGWSNEDTAKLDAENVKALQQYKLFFKILKENNLILVTKELPKEKTAEGTFYHYVIQLDLKKSAAFYKSLTDTMEKEFGKDSLIKFNEATATYLQGEEFQQVYGILQKNITMELWVDQKDFTPRKFSYSLRLVPPDSVQKMQGKQYRLGVSVGLSQINQKFTATAPSPTISVDEATSLVTGQSIDQINLGKQVGNIRDIRTGLEYYFDRTGKYPAALSDLLKKVADVPASSPIKDPKDFSLRSLDAKIQLDRAFVTALPKDAYTKTDYSYSTDGKMYQLKYTIKMPPKDLSSPYGTDYNRSEVVDGTNTATEKELSVETVK